MIAAESVRQEEHIELIASENYASPLVMAAQGGVSQISMRKVIPQRDTMGAVNMWIKSKSWQLKEQGAILVIMQMFNHSGSQANAAVCLALLSGGDTIWG